MQNIDPFDTVVKLKVDDVGNKGDKYWHLADNGTTFHTLCNGDALDGWDADYKDLKKGSVTCPNCLAIIKKYKAIKL